MKKILLVLIIPLLNLGQDNIVDFFNSIHKDYQAQIENTHDIDSFLFNRINTLDVNKKLNKEEISKLFFLHNLFTTNSPTDCSTSGILKIPYFWDDTRRYIEGNEENKRRTPRRFLSDLVSNSPKYSHNNCGKFYTFGWCAEREMAFVALLRNMGFKADVVAANGHAWTQVYINIYVNDDESGKFIKIDNTYNKFEIDEFIMPSIHGCKAYDYNCEICLMKKYYNPRANDKIDNIIVSDISAKRIRERIDNYFNKKAD